MVKKISADNSPQPDYSDIAEDEINKENTGEDDGNIIHTENIYEKCLAALRRNGGFFTDPQVRDTINKICAAYEKSLCLGRFQVAGEQHYLSRDLLSFLIYILKSVKNIDKLKFEELTKKIQKKMLASR